MKTRISLVSFLVLAASAQVQAAPLSWDPAQTPLTPSGSTGNWDLASLFWSNGSTDVAWSDTTGLVDTAIFGGSTGTVTLATNLGARGLVFTTPDYTVTANALTLGSAGIDAAALASGTTTVASNLFLTRGQTWTTGGGSTLALNGTVTRAGTSALTLTGSAGAYTSSTLATTNGIIGAWATVSSTGAAANNAAGGNTYATKSGAAIVPYTDATGLNGAGAWGGIASGGTGTINYDVNSAGALGLTGLGRNINTLRYTGPGATQLSNSNGDLLTANGIMNAGTGTFVIGGGTTALNLVIGSTTQLVLAAKTAGITVNNVIKNNGATPGSVLVHGASPVVFAGINTHTGGTFISGGTVNLSGAGTLGTGPLFVGPGSTLNISGNAHTLSQSVTGGGNIVNTTSNTVNGDFTGFTGTYIHNTQGASTGLNTGTSTSANAAYILSSTQGGAQGFVAGANGDYTLNLGSLTGVPGSLFRGGFSATGTTTLAIGNLNTSTTFAGSIDNGTNKILALDKVGTGTFTLGGVSNYTGPTTITGGTLNLTGSLGNTAVTVGSGAAISGEGTIGSTGSLTLGSGSILRVDGSSFSSLGVGGDLTLTATTTVIVDGTPEFPSVGTVIPLINYGGTLNGSVANLALQNASLFRNPAFSSSPGAIDLVIDTLDLVWSGGTGVWDITGASNWNSGSEQFYQGDAVTFGNTASTKSVNLTATVKPAAVTFNNSAGNDYTLGGTGTIIGSGTFTKLNSGTVTINSPQAYTGTTTLDAGTIAYGTDDALGNGQLILNGGTLALGADHSDTFSSVLLNGGTVSGTGSSTIATTGTFEIETGTVTALIGGTGGLTKSGGGTFVLNRAHTYTGTTTVSSGTLAYGISDAIATGPVTVLNATLDLGANHTDTVGTFTLDGGTITGSGTSALSTTGTFQVQSGTVAAVLAGTSALNKTGSGTVFLDTAATYTGTTTVTDGILAYGVNDAIATGGVTVNGANATLDLGANRSDTVGPVILDGGGTISGTGTSTLTTTAAFFDMRAGNVSAILSGAVGLNKTTAGTLTLLAPNTYTGDTYIGFNASNARIGVIRAAATGAFGTGTIFPGPGGNDATARLELEAGIVVGNTISLSGRGNTSTAIQNISGNNTLSGPIGLEIGGNTYTFQSDAGTLTVSGAITVGTTGTPRILILKGDGNGLITQPLANGGTPSLEVIKDGAGTWTLAGANSYTGNSTVTAGTLQINTDDALSDTATLTIATGATLNLTHAGTDVVGALVVGGIIQPNGTYTFGTGKIQVGAGGSAFDTWAAAAGLDGTPGKENGPGDDPDNDGRNNLGEFAFNGNPLSGSDNGKVFVITNQDSSDPGAQNDLILTLAVRTDAPAFTGSPLAASVDGVTYTIQGSTNLSDFTTTVLPVDPVVPGTLPPAGTGYSYRSFILDGSNGLPAKGFLRARVTN